MSHYSKMQVNFTDAEMLKAALIACGIPEGVVEVGKPTIPYHNYCGGKVGECHVKVNRNHLGPGCNDIAFMLNPEGQSEMQLCDYAARAVGKNFQQKVTREYAIAKATSHYRQQGKVVHRKEGTAGRVHLFVRA